MYNVGDIKVMSVYLVIYQLIHITYRPFIDEYTTQSQKIKSYHPRFYIRVQQMNMCDWFLLTTLDLKFKCIMSECLFTALVFLK